MADIYATSFRTLNYSGMLFNKGNVRTPLSSLIGGRRKTTDHVKFTCGQEYTTGGGTQPNISEDASLTAPDASIITRTPSYNVTQIFHESVAISYAKKSNMGTLAGLNVANQTANPMSELDFQVAAKMAKIARDIEFTFMQGTYNEATTDAQVNKTMGLANAITTNVLDANGKPLGLWLVAEALKLIYDSNAPTSGKTLMVDATTLYQLNLDAVNNKMTIVDSGRTVNGINVTTYVTPLGNIDVCLGEFLPAGTAFVLDIPMIAPVEQPTPAKGNFFLEQLAKIGAGEKYQIFGQVGLDYGPEWYHAKIENLATTFVAP